MAEPIENTRNADHPIERLFLDRWSPRAFSGEAIPVETLMSLFEAARWAPSSYNSQPWRFVWARRDTPHWATFFDLLGERNKVWAADAAALVLIVSATTMLPPGAAESIPAYSHSLDAGAAWENLALQAIKLGWYTHGMVGFDIDRSRTTLNIPADFRIEMMFAIGKQGDKAKLPESMQKMEAPNPRRPLAQTVFEGTFPVA